MAVGDYLFDGGQPPPILTKALNCDKWGIPDIARLPAGLLPEINMTLNYYHAIKGYQKAHKTSEWTKSNPDGWNLVSWIINQRMERKRGNRNQ
jgi:hypothetical protein